MPIRSEVVVGGNFALLDESVAPKVAAQAWAAFTMLREAFPDLQTETGVVVAHEDKVANGLQLTGTHTGVFRGPTGAIPPTGWRATWTALALDQLRDGRVVAGGGPFETVGLLQQLGALPSLERAPRRSHEAVRAALRQRSSHAPAPGAGALGLHHESERAIRSRWSFSADIPSGTRKLRRILVHQSGYRRGRKVGLVTDHMLRYLEATQ